MSDDELLHLSPAEVVAHVRRLEVRIAELEAELARRGGPPKTPANSSIPPSKGWKCERRPPAEGAAKRGPPVGHVGTSRGRATPDWVVMCQPTHCASCGADLATAPQEQLGTSQVVEVPPVSPVVL
jgi:transposase